MGNIVNKEITKDDTDFPFFKDWCFDYIVKGLIDNHGYKIKECKHEIEISNQTLDKTIVKLGELYIVLITEFDKDDMLIRYLISPFAESVCKGDFVDKKYSVESIINSEFLFFAGFSHVNFCKIITFACCNYAYLNDDKYPMIDLVCAMKTTSNLIDEINHTLIQEARISLGTIIIFKCIQYFKDKGFDRVLLECNYKLFDYYKNLFFNIGTGEDNKYPFKRNDIISAKLAALSNTGRFRDKTNFSHLIITDNYIDNLVITKPEKAFKNTLFKMYFNIDRYFKMLKRKAEDKIWNIKEKKFIKTLFDSIRDSEVVKVNNYYNQLMRNYESDFK